MSQNSNQTDPPDYSIDRLSEKIGILTRRETEARILIPVIQALGEEFGREAVIRTVSNTIVKIARDQGRELACLMEGNTAEDFKSALAFWTKDNALEIKMKSSTDNQLRFDVTRCRYAEMYKALGAADLGAVFSCNRDGALIAGFNPDAVMTRTKTIMAGDEVCDFVYTFPEPESGSKD